MTPQICLGLCRARLITSVEFVYRTFILCILLQATPHMSYHSRPATPGTATTSAALQQLTNAKAMLEKRVTELIKELDQKTVAESQFEQLLTDEIAKVFITFFSSPHCACEALCTYFVLLFSGRQSLPKKIP